MSSGKSLPADDTLYMIHKSQKKQSSICHFRDLLRPVSHCFI